MTFICKIFGHKMYSINWTSEKFTVLCTRCDNRWESIDE
jgi:hypothetical protein